MSEKRRELGRATVEVDGRVYGVIVYETTFDEWDDLEGRITERAALYGPDREMPPSPESVSDPVEWHKYFANADFSGPTTRDGGGMQRRMQEQAEAAAATRKAERKARREKVSPDTPTEEYAQCPECEYTGELYEFDSSIYECSRCGGTARGFEEGRRCSECGIFRALVSYVSCPNCEQPVEPVSVSGYMVDGEFFLPSDLV